MTNSRGSIKKDPNIIRSANHGCFQLRESKAWGRYLIPIDDPGGTNLSTFEREGIQLHPDFPVMPAPLWAKWISLCFYMCPENGKKLGRNFHDSQLEVQVCLLRSENDFKRWKIVVPEQRVSGVSVHANLTNSIDIATGEKYTQFPPKGWVHAGSSHSHNTMDAFFSYTDDRSELTVPGMHIVIGNIDHKAMQYSYEASIVLQKNRKTVALNKVVDIQPPEDDSEIEFHEDVIDYINEVTSYNVVKLFQKVNYWSKKEDPKEEAAEDQIETWSIDAIDNNVDLFKDNDENFPFNAEVESLVETVCDAGYSIDDILQAAVMAEAHRDTEEEETSEI